MSEFIEEIRKIRLNGKGHRIAVPGKVTSVLVEPTGVPSADLPFATSYRIEARLGVSLYLTHAMEDDPATTRVQRQLAEAVYGDVRAVVNSMWSEVYSLRATDWERAERLATKLQSILDMTDPRISPEKGDSGG